MDLVVLNPTINVCVCENKQKKKTVHLPDEELQRRPAGGFR